MSIVSLWGTHVATVCECQIRVFEREDGPRKELETKSPVLAVCGPLDRSVFAVTSSGVTVWHGPHYNAEDVYSFEVGTVARCEPTRNGGVLIATATKVVVFDKGTFRHYDMAGVIALASVNKFSFVYATPSTLGMFSVKGESWQKQWPHKIQDATVVYGDIVVMADGKVSRHDMKGLDGRHVGASAGAVKMQRLHCDAYSVLMITNTGFGTVWNMDQEEETFFAGRAFQFASTKDAVWALRGPHQAHKIPFTHVSAPEKIDPVY
jgi:hypothetical protein